MIRLGEASVAGLAVLLALTGCSTGGTGSGGGIGGSGTSGTQPADPSGIYVIEDVDFFLPPSPSMILHYPKTASGSVSPGTTITGPANVIFESMALDASGNLYVGGEVYNASTTAHVGAVDILVYASGASGTATPARSIAPTSLEVLSSNPINAMAVDAAGNLVVAAAVAIGSGPSGRVYPALSVFPPTANGDAAATRVIAGDSTTLFNPSQIAVDRTGNIYVANGQIQGAASILIFGPTASGNMAPTVTLGGSNTTIYTPRGVALDAAGNIYVASQSADIQTPNGVLTGHAEHPGV
jgi:hypothetical protein